MSRSQGTGAEDPGSEKLENGPAALHRMRITTGHYRQRAGLSRFTPPDTGASTIAIPALLSSLPSSRVPVGEDELIPTRTVHDFIVLSRPSWRPVPSTTLRTALPSRNIVMTSSSAAPTSSPNRLS